MSLKDIQDLLSVAGANRRGMKILTFGPTGSGKSPLLASFPRPLMAVDCGEGGIQPYLRPPLVVDGKPRVSLERVFKGEEDLCVTVKGPDEIDRAIAYALDNEDKFASLVIDGYNLSWEDHMDYWNDRLGGDIQGGQWRLVKGPWKARQKKLMRSSLNIGFSCWMRDIAYDQVDGKPGSGKRLEIHSQEVAAIEKSVPYTVDLMFQMRVKLDKLNRPTPNHEIIVVKGRRPSTISPKDLYVGKTTAWRSDKTEDLWGLAIAPYVDAWKDAAIEDTIGQGVEFMGMDAEEAIRETREVLEAGDDAEAGRLVRAMSDAYARGDFKTVQAFGTFWGQVIAPTINDLDATARRVVVEMKEQIKSKVEANMKMSETIIAAADKRASEEKA